MNAPEAWVWCVGLVCLAAVLITAIVAMVNSQEIKAGVQR